MEIGSFTLRAGVQTRGKGMESFHVSASDGEMKQKGLLWSKKGDWQEMKTELREHSPAIKVVVCLEFLCWENRKATYIGHRIVLKQLANTLNLAKIIHCTPTKKKKKNPHRIKWRGICLIIEFETFVLAHKTRLTQTTCQRLWESKISLINWQGETVVLKELLFYFVFF